MDLEARCIDLVVDLGLATRAEVRRVVPLTGGVSSDIARVDLPARRIVVKFALDKLKVKEDWFAPVDRNLSEYEWIRAAARVDAGAVPSPIARSPALNGFAMDFLEGEGVYLWKAALLDGRVEPEVARAVGDVLGRFHAAGAREEFDPGFFDNHDDFHALRLEPYLLFTAGKYPALKDRLHGLAEALYAADTTLIHGDVSPKNIMVQNGQPVFVDAETATMGDPVFDVAFCMNHLVMKAVHFGARAPEYLGLARAFWAAYAARVDWEPAAAVETRLMALLPALMLARVDGKSPLEYFTAEGNDFVRGLTPPLILRPQPGLEAFLGHVAGEIAAR